MAAATVLLLVAACVSTMAFPQPGFIEGDWLIDAELAEETGYLDRDTRGTSDDKKPEPSANLSPPLSAGAFSSSGSFSSSSSSSGGSGGSNSGAGGFYPGYYGVPQSYPYQSFDQQRPPYMPYEFYALFQQFFNQLQMLAQQHSYASNYNTPNIESNTVDYGTGGAGGSYGQNYAPPNFFSFPYGGGVSGSYSNIGNLPSTSNQPAAVQGTGPASDVSGAAAVASLSPQGGFGYADVFPDVSSRFGSVGGEFPKPSGESYGVFTSSASGSSDVNGKKTSFKTATTGINDNGKITVFTKHDP